MKIAFHTLGCKVNQYETEAMAEQFKKAQHRVVEDDEFADVYIINTCTVTNLADRKSRQYIRKMKRVNPRAIIAVTGCYAQISPDEVAKIEGVNIVAGTDEKHNILEYVENYSGEKMHTQCHVKAYEELDKYQSSGVITSMESRTRAYIKIEEGCNRFCSYCIIPYARGKVRSRAIDEIVQEASGLIEKGFKELILTGINTALYGTDLGYDGLEPLIAKIDKINGDFRIRLSSLEPTVIDREYVKKLLKYKKLCPHLHLSIQSGSNKILSKMNRSYDREDYIEITKILKEFDPCYGITTDVIVGFPGEEETDFSDSVKILDEVGFCKVHVFKYSKRDGTKAAEMAEQISGESKNRRSKILMEKAEETSEKFFESNVGAIRSVLFEEITEDGRLMGYTDNYIKAYAEGEETMLNKFFNVKLLSRYSDGMKGEIKDE